MAIITNGEYKQLPVCRTTHEDTVIDAVIPMVEADFLEIQGRDWYRMTADATDGSAVLSDIGNGYGLTVPQMLDRLEVGQLLGGAGIRAMVASIDVDAYTVTLDAPATATGADVAIIIYPRGALMIAARMIAFQINEGQRDSALGTETLGAHMMVTDKDRIRGYPRTVVGGIRRYARVGG